MEDVPWPLQEAINHGLAILAWFENYSGDEIPHENLWEDGGFVERHFDAVREKKKQEMGGDSAYDSADGSDEDMTGNDLASVFKQ